MNNLVKMTRSEYTTAKANRTLVCPNVALISDEYQKVEYLAQNPPSDIGICAWEDGHRTFYSLAQWEELATKPTALGVYVFTEQTQFFIHETLPTGAWSNSPVLLDDVTIATTKANALLDFKGKENTDAVIEAITNGDITDAPLFTTTRALTCSDSSAVFNVPAAGEVEICLINIASINECRALLNQTPVNGFILTSTQRVANEVWNWTGESWNYPCYKTYSSKTIAISDL